MKELPESLLSFSGTNYLGINQNVDFRQLLNVGIAKYGLHYGGSRFSNLCPDIYEEAEALFCKISGYEAALIVSSGTIAGQLATSLIDSSSSVYIAMSTHAALLNNLDNKLWSKETWPPIFSKPNQSDAVFLCNSIDPLYCKQTDFSFIKNLKGPKQFFIDDSHGIGLFEPSRAALFDLIKSTNNLQLTITASLGKAFGIPGGVILSNADIINRIKSSAIFGGGAPPPPAYLYAFINGQAIYQTARNKLRRNITYFKQGIESLNIFRYLDNYPVFYTSKNNLASDLMTKQIAISSFRYPTPESDLTSRVVINSSHKQSEIDLLINSIKEAIPIRF